MSQCEVLKEIPVEVKEKIRAIAQSCDVVMRLNHSDVSDVSDDNNPPHWLELTDGPSEDQTAELAKLMDVYTQPVVESLFGPTFAQRFEELVVSKMGELVRQHAASLEDGHRDSNARARYGIWADFVLWPWEHSEKILLAVGDVMLGDEQEQPYIYIQKPDSVTSK